MSVVLSPNLDRRYMAYAIPDSARHMNEELLGVLRFMAHFKTYACWMICPSPAERLTSNVRIWISGMSRRAVLLNKCYNMLPCLVHGFLRLGARGLRDVFRFPVRKRVGVAPGRHIVYLSGCPCWGSAGKKCSVLVSLWSPDRLD